MRPRVESEAEMSLANSEALAGVGEKLTSVCGDTKRSSGIASLATRTCSGDEMRFSLRNL